MCGVKAAGGDLQRRRDHQRQQRRPEQRHGDLPGVRARSATPGAWRASSSTLAGRARPGVGREIDGASAIADICLFLSLGLG